MSWMAGLHHEAISNVLYLSISKSRIKRAERERERGHVIRKGFGETGWYIYIYNVSCAAMCVDILIFFSFSPALSPYFTCLYTPRRGISTTRADNARERERE